MVPFTPCTCDQIHGPIYTQPILVIKSMVPFTPYTCDQIHGPIYTLYLYLFRVNSLVPFTSCTFVCRHKCWCKWDHRFDPKQTQVQGVNGFMHLTPNYTSTGCTCKWTMDLIPQRGPWILSHNRHKCTV